MSPEAEAGAGAVEVGLSVGWCSEEVYTDVRQVKLRFFFPRLSSACCGILFSLRP